MLCLFLTCSYYYNLYHLGSVTLWGADSQWKELAEYQKIREKVE